MDDDGHGTIKRGGGGNNYSFRLVMKTYVTETETKTKKMKRKRKLLFFLFWLLHQLRQLLKMNIEEEINDEEEHS